MPHQLKKACAVGFGVGVLGAILSIIPFVVRLEETAELDWLFTRRGAEPAPPEVIVVGIDESSAEAMGLSKELDEWPRSVHADLVDNLAASGAATIVFDIHFAEPREPNDDQLFADAIERAGNVVLLEHIESAVMPLGGSSGNRGLIQERRIPPIASLDRNAAGTAPFPLPVVPVKVSQFWAFRTLGGDSPTLPVVALQVYARSVYHDFLLLLEEVRPNVSLQSTPEWDQVVSDGTVQDLVRDTRRLFRRDSTLAADMFAHLGRDNHALNQADVQRHSMLRALIQMYAGGDSLFLNYYGPPRTITTVPYQDAIAGPSDENGAIDLAGRVVFIGFSARTQAGQLDEHYSVFSQASGLSLSGVEIAATAFANLLEAKTIQPLTTPTHLIFVLLWGTIAATSICLVSMLPGLGIAVLGSLIYVLFASYQFESASVWWPLTVPLLIQLPIAIFAANRLQYIDEKAQKEAERARSEKALTNLTPETRNRLKRNCAGLEEDNWTAVCLSTDLEGYLAWWNEEMKDRKEERNQVAEAYREMIFAAVARHGGFVKDEAGDGVLGIWPSADRRKDACRAALSISSAREIIRGHPTRVGLDLGAVEARKVIEPYGYSSTIRGSPVNLASRIQEVANKYFGTLVLASEPVVRGLEHEFLTRELGTFLFEGASEPLVIYELMDSASVQDNDQRRKLELIFARGLAEVKRRNWDLASKQFKRLLLEPSFQGDGPGIFYRWLCKKYVEMSHEELQEELSESWTRGAYTLRKGGWEGPRKISLEELLKD